MLLPSASSVIFATLLDKICKNAFARPASVALIVGLGPHFHYCYCSAACDKILLYDFIRHQIYKPGEVEDRLLDQNRETNYICDEHPEYHHNATPIYTDFNCRYDDHNYCHGLSNHGLLALTAPMDAVPNIDQDTFTDTSTILTTTTIEAPTFTYTETVKETTDTTVTGTSTVPAPAGFTPIQISAKRPAKRDLAHSFPNNGGLVARANERRAGGNSGSGNGKSPVQYPKKVRG